MSDTAFINDIEKKLGLVHKIYDFLRIIDPLSGAVMEKRENEYNATGIFDYEPLCENAIAMRAFRDNECYVKLEQHDELMFLVSVLPIESSGRQVVVELYKNVTSTLSITCKNYSDTIGNLAMKDDLTKLFNRRYVDERLPIDIKRAVALSSPLSLVFLDVDNLKNVNDNLGHEFGDKLLIEVSKIILNSIRANNDWVARYGGDEFLICLNDIAEAEACEIVERIRNKISEPFNIEDESIVTSASLGLFCVKEKEINPSELIALADRKMYEAKKNGKNRIVF